MTATHEQALSSGQRTVDYGNAPVGETALGFFFQPLEGWNVLHLGAVWERFRTKYPEYEILPTLLDNPPQSSVRVNLSSLPIRVGFSDKTKSQLVQIQDGLFLHNWRKTAQVPEYPRYDSMRSQLRDEWATFKRYLRERSLKEPTVTRCQMDYFNHLVRGQEWRDFSDVPKIFNVWQGLKQSAVGTLQMVSFNVSYGVNRGTVNVAVQPAIRSNDGKEIIQFSLSSSVVPRSSEDEELFSGLSECHHNAAQAFIDFTTDAARESWGQRK